MTSLERAGVAASGVHAKCRRAWPVPAARLPPPLSVPCQGCSAPACSSANGLHHPAGATRVVASACTLARIVADRLDESRARTLVVRTLTRSLAAARSVPFARSLAKICESSSSERSRSLRTSFVLAPPTAQHSARRREPASRHRALVRAVSRAGKAQVDEPRGEPTGIDRGCRPRPSTCVIHLRALQHSLPRPDSVCRAVDRSLGPAAPVRLCPPWKARTQVGLGDRCQAAAGPELRLAQAALSHLRWTCSCSHLPRPHPSSRADDDAAAVRLARASPTPRLRQPPLHLSRGHRGHQAAQRRSSSLYLHSTTRTASRHRAQPAHHRARLVLLVDNGR